MGERDHGRIVRFFAATAAHPTRAVWLTAVLCCAAPRPAAEVAAVASNAEQSSGRGELAEASWRPLFDGSSLDEWRGYCQSAAPERWQIEGGSLHFVGGSGADPTKGGDLVTREQWGDFELSLEWKISAGGNSGILYRGIEQCAAAGRPQKPIYESAPEMQVLDNERHPDARLGKDGNRQAGALYDLIAAVPQNARPAGEWNEIRIRVSDGQVTHRMNGQDVVQYSLGTPEWRARCADSKFKDWPHFIDPAARGHIALQDHGDDVWYRNIRIRPL
jgi:hypothetical protein